MNYSIKNDLQVLGVTLLGKYTTTQRLGLSLGTNGAGGIVHDTDLGTLFLWDGTQWVDYLVEVNLSTGTHDATTYEIANDAGDNATIPAATQTLSGLLTAADKTNLDALKDLDGVPNGSTNLGTFTGAIIPDNTTIKGALQSIETDVETFKALKGQPNGLAELDANGLVPIGQLPSLAITDVFVVADIAARNALTPQEGDVAKVNDSDGNGNPQTYIYDGTTWVDIQETSDVISVNGQTGTVVLDGGDIAYDNSGAPTGSPTENETNLQAAIDQLNTAVNNVAGTENTIALTFVVGDWSAASGGQRTLTFTQGDHGLTSANLQILQVQELVSANTYQNVALDSRINTSTGSITLAIRANPDARFEGRIVLTQDH